jgi:hypothetical protein
MRKEWGVVDGRRKDVKVNNHRKKSPTGIGFRLSPSLEALHALASEFEEAVE